MLHHYADIRERIVAHPMWWDEHGVPRYCPFAPNQCANIYAREAALVEIGCQACGSEFLVAFTASAHEGKRLAEQIRLGTLHYGDPPNAGCCPAGPTMNCDDRRVLQYWRRTGFDWQRDPSLEIPLDEVAPSTPSQGSV